MCWWQERRSDSGGGSGLGECASLGSLFQSAFNADAVSGHLTPVTAACVSACLLTPCRRRVAIQEAERWNVLLAEMRRSLAELDLGLRGDLTMTEPMVSALSS